MYRLKVDPAIFEKFPQARVMVLYANGFQNSPSTDESRALIQETIDDIFDNFPYDKPSDHPHIIAWRQVFSAFGAKPKKYHCSAEALIKRVLKDGDLPKINHFVDIYNCLSMKHVIPFGGEDRDALTSDTILTFAEGTEQFLTGAGENEPPEPGEVVWADDDEVVCRRWNWRQGQKTAMTESTTNAYFVIEVVEPFTIDHINAAADDLEGYLKAVSSDVEIERELFEA